MMLLACSGYYSAGGRVLLSNTPWLLVVVLRSLASALPPCWLPLPWLLFLLVVSASSCFGVLAPLSCGGRCSPSLVAPRPLSLLLAAVVVIIIVRESIPHPSKKQQPYHDGAQQPQQEASSRRPAAIKKSSPADKERGGGNTIMRLVCVLVLHQARTPPPPRASHRPHHNLDHAQAATRGSTKWCIITVNLNTVENSEM